jgi:hypothetical protein
LENDRLSSVTTFTAAPNVPVGCPASAYQTSPSNDDLSLTCPATITQRWRREFHRTLPLCRRTRSLGSAALAG